MDQRRAGWEGESPGDGPPGAGLGAEGREISLREGMDAPGAGSIASDSATEGAEPAAPAAAGGAGASRFRAEALGGGPAPRGDSTPEAPPPAPGRPQTASPVVGHAPRASFAWGTPGARAGSTSLQGRGLAHRRNLSRAEMRRSQSSQELRGALGADGLPRVKVAICAMSKKSQSKPMRAILERLRATGEFEIEVFSDDLILGQPQEAWPECDCLVSFFSSGFPLAKAVAYAARVRPYLINDLAVQADLLDRRRVYRRLAEVGIPVPKHIVVSRDGLAPGEDPPGFVEEEDFVELGGQRILKPFVEKPVSGEDHNIHIYYPHSMGGGVKKLFRKIANKSAEFDADHPGTVRRDGSYIYEAFMTTGGTDVKVYTVGPRYAHAEARKSPVVDGKVLRTAEGKEVRFPVLLSPSEKEIARIVSLAFQQKVCGFDLLRSDKGRSYVCDVNGWSFVKSSTKYYDDCAGILR